jgi:hypothetical protein
MSNFVKIAVPPVSQEFIKHLRNAFRPFDLKPGFDRDELMQSAGEQKVIEWIEHHALQGRTVTGNPDAVRSVETPAGAITKIVE